MAILNPGYRCRGCNVFCLRLMLLDIVILNLFDSVHDVETLLTANCIWKYCLKCALPCPGKLQTLLIFHTR